MNKKEYRAAIAKLGLSQEQAGKWLGLALRTSQNYALGNTTIPAPTERLLRLVLALKLTPEKAAKLWSEG